MSERGFLDSPGRRARTGGNDRSGRIKARTKAALIDACRAVVEGSLPEAIQVAQRALDLVEEEGASINVRFNGEVYNPAADDERLTRQLGRVFDAMRGGKWMTLDEIAMRTGDPVASVSAQLRHLRKPRHGSYLVDVQSREGALFEYRLRSAKGEVVR